MYTEINVCRVNLVFYLYPYYTFAYVIFDRAIPTYFLNCSFHFFVTYIAAT